MTCIGNSGPLSDEVSEAIEKVSCCSSMLHLMTSMQVTLMASLSNYHHTVPTAPIKSSVMDLNLFRSCAIRMHSLYFIPIHSVMLSAHVSRCLPLLRFPLICPSSSNLWMSSLLTMCLK